MDLLSQRKERKTMLTNTLKHHTYRKHGGRRATASVIDSSRRVRVLREAAGIERSNAEQKYVDGHVSLLRKRKNDT